MIAPSAPASYRLAHTRTGSIVALRPFERADADGVQNLLDRLSPTSAHRRFLGSSRSASARYVARLRSAVDTLAATVALIEGELVGIASLHLDGEGSAEAAIAVADRDHGDGIGTLLLEALVDQARELGLTRLTATVLTENTDILTVFRDLGLTVTQGPSDAGVMDVTVDLAPSETYDRRLAARTTVALDAATRTADVASALAGWERRANVGARPRVLVVGDELSARDVREACDRQGALAANLTQQAQQRLRFTLPSVVVDDSAIYLTTVTGEDIQVLLGTVTDCPEVDVVVVAIDQPHGPEGGERWRQVQHEVARAQGPALVVTCLPGGVPGSPPAFSSASSCAAALAMARGQRG